MLRLTTTSTAESGRYELCGDRPSTRSQYRRGTVALAHAVYDKVIRILEGRQLAHAGTGELCEHILLPGTKNALRREGVSELEIAQCEAAVLNTMAEHPQWTISRDGPHALTQQLRQTDRTDLLEVKRIAALPNATLNALMCEELLTMFTQSDLLSVPGFVMRKFELEDGTKLFNLRLDIDPAYARGGFFIPIVNARLIVGLRVFRYPHDRRPFVLRSDRGEVALDA